jgi:hypothetical protein
MRVRDNFLHDGVAAIGIGVRAAVSQRVIGQSLEFGFEMAFLHSTSVDGFFEALTTTITTTFHAAGHNSVLQKRRLQ